MSDGQAAVLSADQREVLGQALADALSGAAPNSWTSCSHDSKSCPARRLAVSGHRATAHRVTGAWP